MHTSTEPAVSVVVLTWNEARHINATLAALAKQDDSKFEVIVVDAASTDQTAHLVSEVIATFPVPLRLDVAATRISVGAARNRGVDLARAPVVAFLSADAVPATDWVTRIRLAMQVDAGVFGRQVHAPPVATTAACARGLRYHFPLSDVSDAEPFASDVNAAFHTSLLRKFPFGTSAAASAVDDLLLARNLSAAGHSLRYDPHLVVFHSDVESLQAEWRKNWREGDGWGAHRAQLGVHMAVVSWAAVLAGTAAAFVAWPSWPVGVALAVIAYTPALRRAWRHRHDMSANHIMRGVIVTPPFDLAFLAAYAKALWTTRSQTRADPTQGGRS